MKIVPLIMAAFMLFTGVHPVEKGGVCHDKQVREVESCHQKAEQSHSCCQKPTATDKEEQPTEEQDPCEDGCHCCCCVVLLAPMLPETSFFYKKIKAKQLQHWMVNTHSRDAAHLIWQPPKQGLV